MPVRKDRQLALVAVTLEILGASALADAGEVGAQVVDLAPHLILIGPEYRI